MIRPLALLAALAAAVALTACGSKDDDNAGAPPRKALSLLLDYQPNPDHAGIYAAQARGDFTRAGLNLEIATPGDAAAPLSVLASGRTDLAISYEPEVLLARDKGARVVAVAALAQAPLTSVMAIGSAKITSIADLAGKTVGTAGIPYQSAYLKTLLDDAGVDESKVKQVDVGFNLVPAMVSKRVDATLGAYWNVEGVQLRQERKKPEIIRMESAGLPTYDELVLVAREDWLREPGNGALVRRFVQALQTATRAVQADPQVGVDALADVAEGYDRKLLAASIKATLPVLFPEGDKPFGWMEPREWEEFSRWMLRNKLVKVLPNDAALTNEFLPGEGVIAADEDAR
ncbi:MAG TPA: ABC transporter substrate-binding protein [Solirubrobacteraceae bacterium]